MTRMEALGYLKEYYNRPVFNVKIGICSPQVTDVTFEEALTDFDHHAKYDTDRFEFVYIYPSNYVKDWEQLMEALNLFNLGPGRDRINQYEKNK